MSREGRGGKTVQLLDCFNQLALITASTTHLSRSQYFGSESQVSESCHKEEAARGLQPRQGEARILWLSFLAHQSRKPRALQKQQHISPHPGRPALQLAHRHPDDPIHPRPRLAVYVTFLIPPFFSLGRPLYLMHTQRNVVIQHLSPKLTPITLFIAKGLLRTQISSRVLPH